MSASGTMQALIAETTDDGNADEVSFRTGSANVRLPSSMFGYSLQTLRKRLSGYDVDLS